MWKVYIDEYKPFCISLQNRNMHPYTWLIKIHMFLILFTIQLIDHCITEVQSFYTTSFYEHSSQWSLLVLCMQLHSKESSTVQTGAHPLQKKYVWIFSFLDFVEYNILIISLDTEHPQQIPLYLFNKHASICFKAYVQLAWVYQSMNVLVHMYVCLNMCVIVKKSHCFLAYMFAFQT